MDVSFFTHVRQCFSSRIPVFRRFFIFCRQFAGFRQSLSALSEGFAAVAGVEAQSACVSGKARWDRPYRAVHEYPSGMTVRFSGVSGMIPEKPRVLVKAGKAVCNRRPGRCGVPVQGAYGNNFLVRLTCFPCSSDRSVPAVQSGYCRKASPRQTACPCHIHPPIPAGMARSEHLTCRFFCTFSEPHRQRL